MTWSIGADDIGDLARGAAVLGTGGGGDPYIGALLARQAIAEHGPVTAVGLDELPDDALAITVGMLGAPTVMVEKLPTLESIIAPVRAMGAHLGRPATHVACAEVGGVNSTIPIAAAAALGLPLLDADGMGRAFPELQMVLPTLYGISASPLAFADEKGNVGVVQTVDNSWTERIVRVSAVEMGCSVMICGFAMSGAQARESLVRDSLRRCIDLGSGIARARAEKIDPVGTAVDLLDGRELFAGKVLDVQRATTAGFARGTARLTGRPAVGDPAAADQELVLAFQNEHLIASLGGDEVLATTPDLIIVLEHDTGEPITTEGLRYGQRVRVVAAPSDPRWHSPAALAMVGPGYFGYDVPARRFDGRISDGGTGAGPDEDAAGDERAGRVDRQDRGHGVDAPRELEGLAR